VPLKRPIHLRIQIYSMAIIRDVDKIDHKKIPEILYKYRNWEETENPMHFGRKLLTEKEVYFAAPEQFNDPFDGTLPFKYKKEQLTTENVFKKLVEVFTRNHPDKSETEIHEMCYARQNEAGFETDAYWRNYHKDFTDLLNKTFGILSLSTKRDNILMWSHYSDAHKGYCVGLDTDILFNSVECQIGGILYSNSFPEIDLFDKDPGDIIRLTCTKSREWEYEGEVRLVKYGGKAKLKLRSECIKQIIVGCKMSQSNKDEIYTIKKEFFPGAKFFETRVDDEQFILNFLPIL
jgi:hypothetical protein